MVLDVVTGADWRTTASTLSGILVGYVWALLVRRGETNALVAPLGNPPAWFKGIVGPGRPTGDSDKPNSNWRGGSKKMGTLNDNKWGFTGGSQGKFVAGAGCCRSVCQTS